MDSESEKYLPTHVLMNVFCRLEVKSLVRCTCVCKTWLHTINTPSFASIHLTYQKSSSTANKYVLHQDSQSCALLTHFDPLSYGTKKSKLYYTPELFEKDIDVCDGCSLKVHGICDGLLCISNNGISDECFTYFKSEYRVGDNLHLWNPICRKAKKLPELRISKEYDGFVRKGGVSFGHYKNDYKVIVVSTVGNFYDVSVYSLSTNCWNVIHTNCYYEDSNIVDFCTSPEYTKFVDGIAYMITDTFRQAPCGDNNPPLAVCFDLKAETIQQIKCPEEFFQYRSKFTMEAYGETVAVLGCDEESEYLDMWILFRDKSRSCWENKLVFKLQEVGFSVPVGFLVDGRYLVKTTIYLDQYYEGPTYFFLYNLESLEVTEYRCPKDHPDYRCIIDSDSIESLFLLNEDSVHPFVHKDMESSCNSMLFTLHNYLQKTSPSQLQKLIKSYRELTGDGIAVKFASGLATVASLSVSISYPSIAAAPCMFDNAYRNVLALSLATDYTYKEAEKVKEFLKDPSRFANSVVRTLM